MTARPTPRAVARLPALLLVPACWAAPCRTGCAEAACRAPPAEELPLHDARLAPRLGNQGPEQVHLIGGGPGKVGVVWAAGPDESSEATPGVEYCRSAQAPGCPAGVLTFAPGSESRTYNSFNVGKPQDTNCTEEKSPYVLGCYYDSPVLHVARLEGLSPGSTYLYRIAGEAAWRSFRTPAPVGAPISFGVVADLGQTEWSHDTMQHMLKDFGEKAFDSAIFPGDLSYADGFGPRWDSYGRMAEPLFSQLPTAYTVGNHEMSSGMEQAVHFTWRYPALFLREDSGSTSDLYYSFEAGMAHVVTLCSYCPCGNGSAQYRWLERDLAKVNRTRTPWLVFNWHTPWYTSNAHHTMSEGEEMRGDLEAVLHAAGADIVFNGHVHAYERMHPVYKNQTDPCEGTVYIVIGDGGNREGYANPWVTPETPKPPLYDQPEWSAFREFAFGYGLFRIYNASVAEWQWHKNDNGSNSVSDSVLLYPRGKRPGCQSGSLGSIVV